MKTLSDYHQRPPLRFDHLVGLISLFFIGCMFFYFSWDSFGTWSDQTKMTTSGKTAEATITTKFNRDLPGRGSGPYELYYVFAAEGRAHRGLVRVARSEWQKVSVGDKLEIRYLKDNPSVNEALTARKITHETATYGVIGAILWAFAVWVFIARPVRP